MLDNLEILKEKYFREINKYQEILKQKDIEYNNNINQMNYNFSNNLENILELQKKITKLKNENKILLLKIEDIQKNKIENKLISEKQNKNFSFEEESNRKVPSYNI